MATLEGIKHFKAGEFRHLDLVNQEALNMLDQIRDQYGRPLVLTDDARMPEDKPTGYSPTSLHYKGQAFDIRARDLSLEDWWKLVVAVINVATWVARGQKGGVELELVKSETDKHVHIGFFLDGRQNRLVIKAE